MRKVILITLFALTAATLFAQKEAKAKAVLDKTLTTLQQSGCISLTFSGSLNGKLLMKGACYTITTEAIKVWYDGTTLWSMLAGSDEVNVTTPTPEELVQTNPYHLLLSYRKGYNYQYLGTATRYGKQGYEVRLTPEKRSNVESITFFVTTNYQPLYIKIAPRRGEAIEMHVTQFLTNQAVKEGTFRFDKKQHPGVEVIDLR